MCYYYRVISRNFLTNNLLTLSKGIGLLVIFLLLVTLISYTIQNEGLQEFIAQFGYAGILILAYISGLNLLVPIPAPTFVPLFTASGFPIELVIATMVIGTTLADLTGFFLGIWGKTIVERKHLVWYERFTLFANKHEKLVQPGVFLFAAFFPLPNELFLIPLGLAGFRLRRLLLPLILGTIIHISLLAIGFDTLARLVFG